MRGEERESGITVDGHADSLYCSGSGRVLDGGGKHAEGSRKAGPVGITIGKLQSE